MLDIAKEVELRKDMAERVFMVLEAYRGEPLSMASLEDLHWAVDRALGSSRQTDFYGSDTKPSFRFEIDPNDPTALQMIATNDAAVWLLALHSEMK